MQQNSGQAAPSPLLTENKVLEASFLSIGYYLSTLRQHFPEDCDASDIVSDSLTILTQINSTLRETSKNAEHLKNLKEKFSHNLNSIKTYLAEQNADHFMGLKDIFQKIDASLKNKSFPVSNAEEFSLVEEEIIKGTQIGLKNNKVVKWIIEVAALSNEQIASISGLIKKVIIANFGVEKAKSVFVKSSTGFYKTIEGKPNGATFETIKIMSDNAKPLKIKAAGGVKTKEDALKMITLGVQRIGTSSAKDIVKETKINSEY